MRDLERAQDGTEVKAWELQLITDRAHNLGDRRDAFETMRDLAADAYRVAHVAEAERMNCFPVPDYMGSMAP